MRETRFYEGFKIFKMRFDSLETASSGASVKKKFIQVIF